ncbi:hypothetical protein [Sharpea azabuensis]|uniref:hypothetical protein n=1 Tax=Sharpea azabuensis TaxID=322505 RepID=UPI00051C7327|nr:hypothetical protein [Sharpea azabuensis]
MPRAKKDSKPLNMNLATSTHLCLEEYCKITGLTKTMAVERILNNEFEKEGITPPDSEKAPEGKKIGRAVNFVLNQKIINKLDKAIKKTGLTKTEIVTRALTEYLSKK